MGDVILSNTSLGKLLRTWTLDVMSDESSNRSRRRGAQCPEMVPLPSGGSIGFEGLDLRACLKKNLMFFPSQK